MRRRAPLYPVREFCPGLSFLSLTNLRRRAPWRTDPDTKRNVFGIGFFSLTKLRRCEPWRSGLDTKRIVFGVEPFKLNKIASACAGAPSLTIFASGGYPRGGCPSSPDIAKSLSVWGITRRQSLFVSCADTSPQVHGLDTDTRVAADTDGGGAWTRALGIVA